METKLVLVAVAVALGLLAGCVGDGDGAGRLGLLELPFAAAPLACRAAGDASLNATNAVNASAPLDACNFRATTTNGPGNEVTIAVNPTDPLNVVAGAKDYTARHTNGQCVWDGVYWTKDGGATWGNANLPGSPWQLLTDPTQFRPSMASAQWCITDPVVRFGADGTLYYSFLSYQSDPVTGSKTGNTTFPNGGLNDWMFTESCMGVAVSTDGGESFAYLSLASCASGPVAFHDKQWIETEPSDPDVLYMAWVSFHSGGTDAGGFLRGTEPVGGMTNLFARSPDKGRTWEPVQVLAGSASAPQGLGYSLKRGSPGQSSMVAADGDGNVYVTWQSGDTVWLVASRDLGETFAQPRAALRITSGTFDTATALNAYRTPNQPFLGVDASGGLNHGALYIVWRDHRWGNADIAFARSDDGGARWTAPVKLNDDNGTAAQFFAALDVAPDGRLDVAFVDRRYDPSDYLLDLTTTSSHDGGRTWTANARVTEVSSDPVHSRHQNGMVFIGDYIDVASAPDVAYPVWVDTRHGRADVYAAAVHAPRLELPDA